MVPDRAGWKWPPGLTVLPVPLTSGVFCSLSLLVRRRVALDGAFLYHPPCPLGGRYTVPNVYHTPEIVLLQRVPHIHTPADAQSCIPTGRGIHRAVPYEAGPEVRRVYSK